MEFKREDILINGREIERFYINGKLVDEDTYHDIMLDYLDDLERESEEIESEEIEEECQCEDCCDTSACDCEDEIEEIQEEITEKINDVLETIGFGCEECTIRSLVELLTFGVDLGVKGHVIKVNDDEDYC